jgi:predicted DNA-binding antitoxin AbrB/MazE fold protein
MVTIIDAIYESGVLKPLDSSGLKEQHLYRLVLAEIPVLEPILDSNLADEMQKRTKTLPDGRRVVRLAGVLGTKGASITENEDPIADALDELWRERTIKSESELREFFPQDTE